MNCISEINNTQIDNATYIDIIVSIYKYSDNYSKTSGRLWQYYRNEPVLNDTDSTLVNFSGNSAIFKLKEKITGSTGYYGKKNVEIMVPLKYLSNFWRILEMPLINCENNVILTWSENCVISNSAAN